MATSIQLLKPWTEYNGCQKFQMNTYLPSNSHKTNSLISLLMRKAFITREKSFM